MLWLTLDGFSANLIIREWVNGSLFPLSLNFTAIVSVFLWSAWFEGRRKGIRWQYISGVRTGCFLWWAFAAESARAGIVWMILRTSNDGGALPRWFEIWANVVFVMAGLALVFAVLRGTYIFTPPKWGHRFWLYSAVSTIVFLMLSHCLPFIGFGR
jgi:hypothetical protein